MEIKNTFVQGKMNKDIDERLLPKGEYPHAENIRLANTEGADLGAIENSEGNKKLSNLNLTNAKTIGAFADGSNQKMYWFTTSGEKDLVLEHDLLNNQTNIILESSNPESLLNFDEAYLITGVSKIINGDSDKDLLIWTDGLNPPRKINIERAKTYGLDGFEEDDISLIKRPPRFAPRADLTYSSSFLENNIEDRFLSFSYRYKYLDGEYSALSSYTNYKFSPSKFELDFQTMENKGMQNSFNAIRVNFNTGSKRVVEIQLVFKESESNALSIIETFNKKDEGWGDNEEESYLFTNSKRYTFLPEDELFRAYDNVPRTAKALEMIGNRLVFGNYTEGYDLVNKYNEKVVLDYELSLLSKDVSGIELRTELVAGAIEDDTFLFDLGDNELNSGTRITFEILLQENTYSDGNFSGSFDFILNRDYTDAIELSEDEDFISFIEVIMTNVFLADYVATPPSDSELTGSTPFMIAASTADTISISSPSLSYTIDNTPADGDTSDGDTRTEVSNWVFTPLSNSFYKTTSIDSSLKTNRSYELGKIYMDGYNRSTTVLTTPINTIYVPQSLSISQNKILVNISHTPPVWADRYKFVVKQNKASYETIYTSIFYEDGLYRWVKLEGANVNKVKKDDTLIVKSDLGGVVNEVVKVRVLDVVTKQPDFIEGNAYEESGEDIIEEAGLYMKIKPSGFDMNFEGGTILNYDRYDATKSGFPSVNMGQGQGTLVGYLDSTTGNYVDYEITGGSRISVKFRNYESDGYDEVYEKDFIVQSNYANFQQWWEAEVINLGNKENLFNWSFIRNADNSLYMNVQGTEGGATFERSKLSCQIDVSLTEGIVIFETSPEDSDIDVYYETEQTFEIIDGKHQGNVQNQTNDVSAIVELDFFNCYVQGNGAESYKVKDAFNQRALSIDLRPSTTSIEGYSKVNRFADLTYSAPYNENANLNGLNEFNLSLANYKEDVDKKYGSIQKLFSRDTDLIMFQEDKVSRVLYGKDLLMNADGTSNVSRIEEVLGQQVAFKGEYGISRNPESFTFDGFNIYFTDAKRGAVMRLGNNGLNEISTFGLRTFFRDRFKDSLNNKKIAGFDPHNDQYVLHPVEEATFIPLNLKCGQNVVKENFSGEQTFIFEYGIGVGDALFNYSSNGLPIRFTTEWNGQTSTTGFIGDSIYNNDLQELGLPSVSSSGAGTLTVSKTLSSPTEIKVTVEAPLCDTNFTLNSSCIDSPELKVVSVILNDPRDKDLSMLSSYSWKTNSYNSPSKKYNTIFNESEVELFKTSVGEEGSSEFPINGSTIKISSFNGYNQTAEFKSGNRLGYLVSNTKYDEFSVPSLVTTANFPLLTETVYPNGDILHSTEFNFDRSLGETYLYLIWDYRDTDTSSGGGETTEPTGSMSISLTNNQILDNSLNEFEVSKLKSDNLTTDPEITAGETVELFFEITLGISRSSSVNTSGTARVTINGGTLNIPVGEDMLFPSSEMTGNLESETIAGSVVISSSDRISIVLECEASVTSSSENISTNANISFTSATSSNTAKTITSIPSTRSLNASSPASAT